MVTDPRLVFLDEPTSGLDSENALKIIKLLKKETQKRGCSIICTLHQPSTNLFKLFDHVICLSDGDTIYNGPVADIKDYYEKKHNLTIPRYNNPSDYLIKLAIDPTLVRQDLTIFQLSTECDKTFKLMIKAEKDALATFKREDIKNIKTIRNTTFKKQCRILLRRQLTGFWRVPFVLFAVFGNAIFANIIISSIFYNVGSFEIGYDMASNKHGIKDWLGLSFYAANDVFAWALMSQVV